VEFRRITALPPYVFAEIDRLKLELRRAGEDVIDLGFGNRDIESPTAAVEKLGEAARIPSNHTATRRAGESRSCGRRSAASTRRPFGVALTLCGLFFRAPPYLHTCTART